jgi:hypothetical protein
MLIKFFAFAVRFSMQTSAKVHWDMMGLEIGSIFMKG